MKLARNVAVLSIVIGSYACLVAPLDAKAPARRAPAPRTTAGGGAVYPQCLYQGKLTRWIAEQMPIRVWVSHGLSMDSIVDPATGAPVTNTANTAHWGDAVIQLLQSGQISALPVAPSYNEEQYNAAVSGLAEWKRFEPEGLFKYEFTDNPEDADVYVFWTNHFVNKLGLALFENDIRGQTSKWLLPAEAVVTALQRNDVELIRRSRKPVVILLRTTDNSMSSSQGGGPNPPMNTAKMRAAAAHEMGHVLGIDGHSPVGSDLMSVYYGNGNISANDAATIRYVYKHAAQMIP